MTISIFPIFQHQKLNLKPPSTKKKKYQNINLVIPHFTLSIPCIVKWVGSFVYPH
ncbi:hypothetical protein Hanom_Chr01g00004241 [Helianthus anomalus]